MSKLLKILNSDGGKIMISILLGIGLASLFRKACEGRDCMIFKAPPAKDIKGETYEIDNKCYNFREKNAQCGKKEQQLNYE